MKTKELIKILNAADPDSEVIVCVGLNDDFREMYAKKELVGGECLGNLLIKSVTVYGEEGGSEMNAVLTSVLEDDSYLYESVKDFDKTYHKTNSKSK